MICAIISWYFWPYEQTCRSTPSQGILELRANITLMKFPQYELQRQRQRQIQMTMLTTIDCQRRSGQIQRQRQRLLAPSTRLAVMQEISLALQKGRTATEAFDKSWQPTAIELKRSKSKDTESI